MEWVTGVKLTTLQPEEIRGLVKVRGGERVGGGLLGRAVGAAGRGVTMPPKYPTGDPNKVPY